MAQQVKPQRGMAMAMGVGVILVLALVIFWLSFDRAPVEATAPADPAPTNSPQPR
ncbi:hypothetical protein [Terrihabitans rhizophilus]|jgi:hypothetical protein|uniref:Uncharacterized protein n=1 Tax=Terrihabitans rhizophilus TaxID=3092662 RepID=A0ABU4RNR6_9HYPH|nr:hypothetical protein [Terrihabitans sp. PJ23]MDX6805843.1 hypothetical protein [Terrihabitans sp. PJ23]